MLAQVRRVSFPIAWLALAAVIAGLGLLGWRGWDVYAQVAFVLAVVFLAAFVALEPGWVRERLGGRTTRYGSNAVVLSLAFLTIVGLLGFLSKQYTKRWDVTASQRFTLSEQTISLLKGLKEPVHATLYYGASNPSADQAKNLMAEYTAQTSMLTYEVVDPELKPAQAIQAGVTSGTVFTMGNKKQIVNAADEQGFTSAIIKLTQTTSKTVYFTTGHKEFDPSGGAARGEGYSVVKQALQQDNFTITTLNLAISTTVPADAAVVIVAGPQQPFSDADVNALKSYLDKGGKGMFLLDPPQDPTAPDSLADLLAQWGIRPQADVVIADPNLSLQGDRLTPATSTYLFSTVTRDLNGATTFFPRARSLQVVSPAPQDTMVQPLVQTGPQSWGQTDFAALKAGQARANANDPRGPLTLAATAEKSQAQGKPRVMVVGNASFVADVVLQQVRGSANLDFFMNGVNWLTESEDLIGIRPKAPDQRTINVFNAQQWRWVFLSSVLVLPLAVLLYGAGVWWRRR